MTTFGKMAEEVSRKLAGFTLRQDRQTHLTADLSATATTISVDSANNISTGIIQIGSELLYITGYDRTAKTLTVPPYGRGYNGTNAQTHQTGSRVVIAPTFPIVDIKQELNNTILAVGDRLYTTAVHTFTFSPAVSTYALPNEVDDVISVTYQTTGPTKEWMPVRGWRLDKMANTGAFNSTKSLTLLQPVEPGRTVQVFYKAKPNTMQNDSDDFAVVTGLPESCRDVIVLGAQANMLSNVDPGRLTFGSAEADQQSQAAGRAYGAGTNTAKYVLALYEKRLAEEMLKMRNENPIRIHYTR